MSGAPSLFERVEFDIDSRALARALVVLVALAGTAVALVTVLFRRFGPASDSLLATILEALAQSLVVIGGAVVLVSLAAAWYLRSTESTLFVEPADEAPPFATPEGTAAQFHDAIQATYRGETDDSLDQIHELLVDSAVRTLRTRRGLDARTARVAVESGTWTDDPVAAAFLADERDYPLPDRLYRRVDPGGAYQRRVRRTLDAIDAVDHGEGNP